MVLLTKCGPYKIYAADVEIPDWVWSLEEISILAVWLGRFAPFPK